MSSHSDAAGEKNKYSEVKEIADFIKEQLEVRKKGKVYTGYWGWVYKDTPELLLRLDFTPWSVLRWLYEHPSSRVKQLLMDAVKENQVDADRLKHAISTVDDPKVKQYWKNQFNLK